MAFLKNFLENTIPNVSEAIKQDYRVNDKIDEFFGSLVENAVKKNSAMSIDKQYKSEQQALRSELQSIENHLSTYYLTVGEQYVDYLMETKKFPVIDIRNLLETMKPQVMRKKELEKKLADLEQLEKNHKLSTAKVKCEQEYMEQKGKLDKALVLGIIAQDEHDEQLRKYKNKIDHFDEMMKVEEAFTSGTIDEHERKVRLFELGIPY